MSDNTKRIIGEYAKSSAGIITMYALITFFAAIAWAGIWAIYGLCAAIAYTIAWLAKPETRRQDEAWWIHAQNGEPYHTQHRPYIKTVCRIVLTCVAIGIIQNIAGGGVW